MNKLEFTLQEIGLNDREIKVYLSALELGNSTVLPISKKAGLKRTYCYDILADLQKRGLVTYFEQNNRRRYVAEDPLKIKDILQNHLKNFEDVLPELRSLYNQSGVKPKVRFYEGIDGIISVYQDLTRANSYDAICSPNHIYKYLGDQFTLVIEEELKKNVKVRELITPDGINAQYIKNYQKPLQEVRLLPEGTTFSTDMIIFENKLALTSYDKNIHSIVIESPAMVQTFKILFNLLWTAGKKYK